MRQITINGQEWPVAFRLKALRMYQEITGKNLLKEDLGKILSEELDPQKVTAVVYCAMVNGWHKQNGWKKEPPFSMDEVEDWIELSPEIFKEVIAAYLDFVQVRNSNGSDPNSTAPQMEGTPQSGDGTGSKRSELDT